jgi:hypothetical protein
MLPISEVQAAIYTAIAPVVAPVKVLDHAGPNELFPYITLGEFIASSSDPLTAEAVDLDMTIHVWSRQPGMQECENLMAQIKDALQYRDLPAANFEWVTTVWQYAQTMRDADGVTRHGVLRFRVMTFQP